MVLHKTTTDGAVFFCVSYNSNACTPLIISMCSIRLTSLHTSGCSVNSWCLKPLLLTALVLVPAPLALDNNSPYQSCSDCLSTTAFKISGLYADTTLGNNTYVESGDEEEVDGPSVENGLPHYGTWLHPRCCLIQMVRPRFLIFHIYSQANLFCSVQVTLIRKRSTQPRSSDPFGPSASLKTLAIHFKPCDMRPRDLKYIDVDGAISGFT